MLCVAVVGTLANHIKAFSTAEAKTLVEWSLLPSSDVEVAKLDLIVYVAGDLKASRELARVARQNTLVQQITAIWNEVPSLPDLDTAIQNSLADIYGFVVGYSTQMHVACKWIRAVSHQASATLDLRTLITGETGTGKELVARAIHKLDKSRKRFVAVNCSAIPSTLLEAELFGHTEGAFTGATKRLGWFGAAAGGTVFLDEVGDLAADLQSKLLRVLEERKYSPLGTEKEFSLDARIVSATNQQLDESIKLQKFRPDLYFRLAQVNIFLPNLNERKEDIPLLIDYFFRESPFREVLVLDKHEIAALSEHQWPGNIRELRVSLERYALLWSAGHKPSFSEWIPKAYPSAQTNRSGTLADLREEFDRRILEDILRRFDGDTSRAAEELGITRRSIYNLIHRHGILLEKRK